MKKTQAQFKLTKLRRTSRRAASTIGPTMLAKNSMHTSLCVVLFLWATMFCYRETVQAQSDYSLRSPDQRIEVKIRASDRLTYDVLLKGAAILQNSTLSMKIDGTTLGERPRVKTAVPRTVDRE